MKTNLKVTIHRIVLIILCTFSIQAKEEFNIPESLINQVESGNAEIAYFIASKLLEGTEKFKADYDKGMIWLNKAAHMGYAHAMQDLADEFDSKENYKEALTWYKKAADLGIGEVMDNIAGYHYSGKAGLKADCQKAYQWYEKAEIREVELAFNNHAWSLATSNDESCRNPERALKIIINLWSIYSSDSVIPWFIWDTKSAVLASVSDFGAAIKLQKWIISELKKDGLDATNFQLRLDSYVLRRPWIESLD